MKVNLFNKESKSNLKKGKTIFFFFLCVCVRWGGGGGGRGCKGGGGGLSKRIFFQRIQI